MNPIRDDDLILYYYGESPVGEEIERQLADSDDLKRRYNDLRRLLDAVEDPARVSPGEFYGARIWQRIEPRLATRSQWTGFLPRTRWAWGVAMLLLLISAFLAGRLLPRPEPDAVASLPAGGPQRILLMTVADHLERSEMLLLEVINTSGDSELDLSLERRLADELGEENRLYRQAALLAGEADIASLLGQLETFWTELANGPETVSADEMGVLRVRLEDGDALFKIRVLGARIRRQARAAEPSLAHDSTARDT